MHIILSNMDNIIAWNNKKLLIRWRRITCSMGRSLITYNTWNKLLRMEPVILITIHILRFLNTSRGFIENTVSVGVWCISNKLTKILVNRIFMMRIKHLQLNGFLIIFSLKSKNQPGLALVISHSVSTFLMNKTSIQFFSKVPKTH